MSVGLSIESLKFNLGDDDPGSLFLDLTSLQFREGISILWGISGSGKTTFLETLCGMRGAEVLRINLDGQEYDFCHISQKEGFFANFIGVQYQEPELLMELSCLENLRLMEQFSNKPSPPYDFFLEVISTLELDSVIDQSTSTLSRGEAQRLSIARALLYAQRLLILDEPLVYFQKKLQAKIWELICNTVSRKGLICLMTTHDPSFAKPQGEGAFYSCSRDAQGRAKILKTSFETFDFLS